MTARFPRPLAAGPIILLVGAVAGGCTLARVAQPTPDDLSTWRAEPLPPDAALAALALGGPCLMDDPTDNIVDPIPQILVQDRRTNDTAVFLVRSPVHFGSCTITRGSGAAGSGYGPPLEVTSDPISIDDRGSGSLGDGTATELGGRITVPAARVVVQLDDGRNVTASVANGFWLTWWPGSTGPARVVALDEKGDTLATLEVVDP